MKRILFATFCVLSFLIPAAGQTQKGMVRTAGSSSAKGAPLGGVTVRLQGDFNPVVSDDRSGEFAVEMPHFRNGDGYFVQDVYKKGYVLIDKSFLSQEHAFSSRVPLQIVLKSRAEIARDQERIEENVRASLYDAYDQERRTLQAKLAAQEISLQKYDEQIEDLRRRMEGVSALSALISEQYAVIDYDVLNEGQRQIIARMEAGDFRQADSLVNLKGDILGRLDNFFDDRMQLEKAEAEYREAGRKLARRRDNIDAREKELLQDVKTKLYSSVDRRQVDSLAFLCHQLVRLDSTDMQSWRYAEHILDWIGADSYFFGRGYLSLAIARKDTLSALEAAIDLSSFFLDRSQLDSASAYLDMASRYAASPKPEEAADYASLFNMMGKVAKTQGNKSRAAQCFLQADELLTNNNLETNPLHIHLLLNLAQLFSESSLHTYANAYLQKAMSQMSEEQLNAYPDIYQVAGAVALRQDHYEEAKQWLEKALEQYAGDPNPKNTITIHQNLGTLYFKMGNTAQALAEEDLAASLEKQYYGETLYLTLCWREIAWSLKNSGLFDEAESYALKSLELRQSILGENAYQVADMYNILGTIAHNKYDEERAKAYFNKAIGILNSTSDPDHILPFVYGNISGVYIREKDYDAAYEYAVRALEEDRAIRGDESLSVANDYSTLGYIRFDQGLYDLAESLFKEAERRAVAVRGEQNVNNAPIFNNLANALGRNLKTDEALYYAGKAKSLYVAAYGEHTEMAYIMDYTFARILHWGGRDGEALPYAEKAADGFASLFGEESPRLASRYELCRDILNVLGRKKEASRYQQKLSHMASD